jgi:NAD(P)-dependent dehydrogenase (short-subunit alcohol dehydrogenase family)
MNAAAPAPTRTHPGRVLGKTAIVTGGSGELGAATVRLLVEHGATVANLDRSAPREPWGTDVVTDHLLDITDAGQVAAAVAVIVEKNGPPDILVNIAGMIGRPAASHEATEEEFDAIFDVNVKGLWLMTKHVVPHMIEAGRGSIINFSSIYGITGGKTVPLYHATKGAVRLLTKADAATYGEHGIRVNSIHPGSMNTTMSRSAAERSPLGRDEYYRRLFGSNPLPRQGEPMEIAYGVLYLASDESSFTTGAEFLIDGGFTAI